MKALSGLPAQVGFSRPRRREWIETSACMRCRLLLRVSPVLDGGSGLKQVGLQELAAAILVSPVLDGGSGLKLWAGEGRKAVTGFLPS